MGSTRWTMTVLSACAVLAGCSSTPVDGAPVVHIAEAAKPSVSRALDQVLPTVDELATILGTAGYMGQLVKGGPEMLLQGVSESEATPIDCVSAGYRLEKIVYRASPVRSVASQSWVGGDQNGPSYSGFFGVVQFATPDDAQAFFAASADKWHRCNGQTLVLHQPEHGADGLSRITDVGVDDRIVSAVVLHDNGSTIQRAIGVATDCVVDVEVTNPAGDSGTSVSGGVGVANRMLQKIGVS
ncbi:MAG TPA: sensor domain-containing protein [Mycobacterium sp.]|jgi:PknH-like protein|nr:sensor domain-containing protein [Mycobacterium sp.]